MTATQWAITAGAFVPLYGEIIRMAIVKVVKR